MLSNRNVHTYDNDTCVDFCQWLFGEHYKEKLMVDYSDILFLTTDRESNKIFLDLRKYDFDNNDWYCYYLFDNVLKKSDLKKTNFCIVCKLLCSSYYVDMLSTLVKYDDDQWFGMVLKLFAIMDGFSEHKNTNFLGMCEGFGDLLFCKQNNDFKDFTLMIQDLDCRMLDSINLKIDKLDSKHLYWCMIKALYKFRCNMIHGNTAFINLEDVYNNYKNGSRKFRVKDACLFMNQTAKSKMYDNDILLPLYSISGDGVDGVSEISSDRDGSNKSIVVSRSVNYSIIVQYLCTLITLATLLDKPEEV